MKGFEKFCAHGIVVCAALVALGPLLITGWLPPLPANMSAGEVKAMFEADLWEIRIGMTITGFAGMFYTLAGSAISTQLERMGPDHAALARVQFVMASGTGLIISFVGFLGMALAYRPTIEPTTLQFGLDLWWLLFVGWYVPALWQYITIAWAIFNDRGKAMIYPRWVGYLNIWVSISLTPGLYMGFFHEAPFAWHGIFGFWLVAVGFFAWSFIMWRFTLRAIANWKTEAA
jgi:hypothetical protein